MQETKFILHGQFHRANGWVMNDSLSYMALTQEEAIANCKRNNPEFHVMSCWIDESKPEVVKVQSLR